MTLRARQAEAPTAATVHYLPDFAARGGPRFTGPTEDRQLVLDETTAAVELLFMASGPLAERWVAMDVASGDIYAGSTPDSSRIGSMTTRSPSATYTIEASYKRSPDRCRAVP